MLHQRVVAAEKARDDAAEQLFHALRRADAAAQEVQASQELRQQLQVRGACNLLQMQASAMPLAPHEAELVVFSLIRSAVIN